MASIEIKGDATQDYYSFLNALRGELKKPEFALAKKSQGFCYTHNGDDYFGETIKIEGVSSTQVKTIQSLAHKNEVTELEFIFVVQGET